MNKLILKFLFTALLFTLSTVPCLAQDFGKGSLEIIKQNGDSLIFEVEIANTVEQRQLGLMHRTYLPWKTGMFMDFEYEQVINMWMKNTPLPLDMIFVDSDGTIFKIVEDTKPYTFDTVSSDQPGRYVLEVLAGSVSRFDIKVGDKVALY